MNLDYFRLCSAWNEYANRRIYDAPADPWRLVEVDPTAIERWATVSLRWGLGRVRGGDWDLPSETSSFRDLPVYQGLEQRFDEGLDWAETDYYDRVAERIENEEGGHKGIESVEEIDSVMSGYQELYESIRDEGYRTNKGVLYDSPEAADFIHDLEPMVLIARDGEVILTEGFHRTAIAAHLGLAELPVYVLRRHERWQHVRDRVANAVTIDEVDVPEHVDRDELADHPDLADVRSGC